MNVKTNLTAIALSLICMNAWASDAVPVSPSNTDGPIDAALTTTSDYVNAGANLDPQSKRTSLLSFFDDRFVISGAARVRADSGDTDANYAGVSKPPKHTYSSLNLETWFTARIWRDWKAKLMVEPNMDLETGKMNSAHDVPMKKFYLEGSITDNLKTRIGKFGAFSSFGRLVDTEVTGIELYSDNKVLPTKIVAARVTKNINDNPWGARIRRQALFTAQSMYPITPDTAIGATIGYLNNLPHPDGKKNKGMWMGEIGIASNFAPDWYAMFAASKSNIDEYYDSAKNKVKNDGYFAQVKFKNFDWDVANSYDVFLNLRHVGAMSGVSSAEDYTKNVKGIQIGGNWVAYKNLKFNTFYLHGKQINSTVGNEKQNVRVWRAQVEYKF